LDALLTTGMSQQEYSGVYCIGCFTDNWNVTTGL